VFNDQIPKNPKRHSIEHVEVIDDGLLNEIKNLGIIVSAQPNFAGRWSGPGGLNEKRLGKDRLLRCNAYKKFLDKKIPLIFGSDSMPLNPLFGIKSAIFHPISEQRISPIDAIKAYVQNYYKIFNLESNFGSIESGKVADLVILTADPFVVGEGTFDKIQVAGTIINGEIVFSKL
jgi:predicted amidohydrolase YtcJ